MSEHRRETRSAPARCGPLRISLVALRCVLRSLPRFFCASPKTPLRVLGIIALDTLRVLRTTQPLPQKGIGELAMVLDFLGCTNAAWDHKDLCRKEYETTRERLHRAGLGAHVDTYLSRLRELEGRRPRTGGDHRRFDEVRSYREAVARLCVGTAAAIALNAPRINETSLPAERDPDVDTLVRILLQCQIIDDVVDYPDDVSAGLPSFLTATVPLSQAMELTSAGGTFLRREPRARIRLRDISVPPHAGSVHSDGYTRRASCRTPLPACPEPGGSVSKSRNLTWPALIVLAVGVMVASVLGLFLYVDATMTPLHPDPQKVPVNYPFGSAGRMGRRGGAGTAIRRDGSHRPKSPRTFGSRGSGRPTSSGPKDLAGRDHERRRAGRS